MPVRAHQGRSLVTNTILLVVILLILVAAGVYWYTTYGPGAAEPEQQNGLDFE